MGVYSKYIYPRIIEILLSIPSVTKYRRDLLSKVKGNILEIGFGTGLNLPCYPEHVNEITVLDINEGMNSLASKRMQFYDKQMLKLTGYLYKGLAVKNLGG